MYGRRLVGYILPGYNSERSISKSVLGNRILFEETTTTHPTQLSIRMVLFQSFCIVRTATLVNLGIRRSLDIRMAATEYSAS